MDTKITQPDATTASGTEKVQASTQTTSMTSASRTTPAPAQQSAHKTDDEVKKEIEVSYQGGLFQALMNGTVTFCEDIKAAIMTLLCVIAGFTQDLQQINRLFCQGALVPTWWNDFAKGSVVNSRRTYAEYFISRALATYTITVPTIFGPVRLADHIPDLIYGMDDVGNSRLFAALFNSSCRYCPDNKKWYAFDGKRWVPNEGWVVELCKIFTERLNEYARRCAAIDFEFFPPERLRDFADYAPKNPHVKHTERSKSRRVRDTILKDASTDIRMVIPLKSFDSNPYLFNCLNGTIDLRNGTIHPHTPSDLLTKMANVEYRPGLRSQLWEKHVSTVMCGDSEAAIYLQKALGYALTGTNKYACFMVLYGPLSRNGKSATMDTFNTMMGDYGGTANPETFAQKFHANGSAHSDDLARLVGTRFVSVPESEQTMTLSASLVKRCTGDGEITARPIFEPQVTFTPQFKLFFHTNHLPRINDLSMFDSNRVKVIPFMHYFEESERNPNMVAELTTPENLSAILNWALEGWRMLETTGFQPPKAVLDATAEYQQESDRVGNFMDECMMEVPGAAVSTREVYERYKAWCDASGLKCGREQDFKKDLERRNISIGRPRVNGSQVTSYLGWQLRPLGYGPGPGPSVPPASET